MRFVACVGLLAGCLLLAGCSSLGFGRKPQGAGPTATPRLPAPVTPTGVPRDGAPDQPAASPFSGVLAGRVIDSYNRRPPPTYIQVVQAKGKDGKEPSGAPIEVATDSNGYFTIQGLQPGRSYQLIARAKDGDRKLAGMTWARPPDPRLLIRVSEDFVTPGTPDVPASPGTPTRGQPAGERSQLPPPVWPDSGAVAGQPPAPDWTGSAEPGSPLRRAVELGQPLPRAGAPVSDTPGGPPSGHRDRSREITIPGGPPVAAAPDAPVSPGLALPSPAAPVAPAAGPVPFCVLLSGRKLDNFALNDLNGKRWEFRRNRRGRLVLLDFWWTGCIPCRQAIPHLNILQQNYGPYGLEVVSLAYETGTPEEQARKVRGVRDRYSINYRLLLGTGLQTECPVRTQFQVTHFPTMVLIDESGQIILRLDGLDAQRLRELETEIKRRLNVR